MKYKSFSFLIQFAADIIKRVRDISRSFSLPPVGILLELNGPKIRTGRLENGKRVLLEPNQTFRFINDISHVGNKDSVPVCNFVYLGGHHLP
jgi:pyruvate kinase